MGCAGSVAINDESASAGDQAFATLGVPPADAGAAGPGAGADSGAASLADYEELLRLRQAVRR
jgi:hypothetical protein